MSTGPGAQVMGDCPGLLVRQKLDKMEIFCAACQKRNKYKIANIGDLGNADFDNKWTDKAFKDLGTTMKAKESSDLLCRVCCMNRRAFEMDITNEADDSILYKFKRDFKFAIPCGCIMIQPNELDINDPEGNRIGKVVQDFRWIEQMCCKTYWVVKDKDDAVIYNIQNDQMCNANMFAPSPCCEVRHMGIFNADQTQEVGSIQNLFPGCNMRAFCAQTDSYKLSFPTDATPDQKASLLGALMLIEYMMFEKSSEDQ